MDLKKIGLGAALWAVGVAMAMWKQVLVVGLMKSNYNYSAANATMEPINGFVGLFALVMWIVGGILMVSGLRSKVAK